MSGQGRRRALAAQAVVALAAAALGAGLAADCRAAPERPAREELAVDGVRLELEWRGSAATVDHALVRAWLARATRTVAAYFGRFPVPRVRVLLAIADGQGVRGGRAFGYPMPRVELDLGQRVTAPALDTDWVLIHELTHLALPEVADDQNWLAEGLATYVEGIARVQAGNLSAAALWQEYVRDMPKGLPGPGDGGLDRTHTWGRTYWGGALFFLVADVRIREATANRLGLQDALRAICRDGAGMAHEWSAARIFAVGDAATGTPVLGELYASMRESPVAPDLTRLWADLGIRVDGGAIAFDEGARLAEVRRAITAVPRRPD